MIIYSGFIFIMSSIPAEELPEESFVNFYLLAHFFEFIIFGFLSGFAFKGSFLIPAAAGIIYSGFDEFHQLFTPGRYCSFIDFIVDTAGVVVGVYLFNAILKRFNNEKK